MKIRFVEKEPRTAWVKAGPSEYGFYPTSTQPSITRAGVRQPSGASANSATQDADVQRLCRSGGVAVYRHGPEEVLLTVLATVGVVQLPLALAGPAGRGPLATLGTTRWNTTISLSRKPSCQPTPCHRLSAAGLRSSRHRAAGIRHRHIPDVCTQGATRCIGCWEGYMLLMLATAAITLFMPARSAPPARALWLHSPVQCFRLHHRAEGLLAARRHDRRTHLGNMIGLYIGGLLIAGSFAFMPGGCLTNGCCFTERGGCCSTLRRNPPTPPSSASMWTLIAVGPAAAAAAGFYFRLAGRQPDRIHHPLHRHLDAGRPGHHAVDHAAAQVAELAVAAAAAPHGGLLAFFYACLHFTTYIWFDRFSTSMTS